LAAVRWPDKPRQRFLLAVLSGNTNMMTTGRR
jgi:hypothetical protein